MTPEERARILLLSDNLLHGATTKAIDELIDWYQSYHAKMSPPKGEWVVPLVPDWLWALKVTARP